MKAIKLGFLVLAVLALGSCSLIFNLFVSAPRVTLSYDTTTLYSTQSVDITANASDPNGGTLTYEWFENGTKVSLPSTTTLVTYYAGTVLSPVDVVVMVRVTDTDGHSATAQVTLNLYPGATVIVSNHSATTVSWLYMRPNGTTTWSSDLLGSYTIPTGYDFTISDVVPGMWDVRAQDFVKTTTWDSTKYLTSGEIWHWDLN